jgi:hypothetical protein
VEDASEHPVGRAIAAGARARGLDVAPVDQFRSHQGLGVSGRVADREVVVGRERFVARPLPAGLAQARAAAEEAGRTAVLVGWDGAVRAMLVVADSVKPTSRAAVAHLRRLGLRPVLLTGDNEAAARAIAAEIGIDDVIAGAPGRNSPNSHARGSARLDRYPLKAHDSDRFTTRAGTPGISPEVFGLLLLLEVPLVEEDGRPPSAGATCSVLQLGWRAQG